MDYDVTKSSMAETFQVPTVVVDKYLKLTNPTHLQILLWMLRVGLPQSSDSVAENLRLDKATVGEAMFYWIECGVLVPCAGDTPKDSEVKYAVDTTALAEPKEEPKRKPKVEKASKLGTSIADTEDLIKRAEESEGFKFLLDESQKAFGRTISRAEQSMLLSLMDNFGLPPEVILMLIHYCVSAGKRGTAYIQKTGEGWAEDGIFTLEAAEQRITSLRSANKLWSELAVRIGNSNPRPTKKQEEYLSVWNGQWHFDLDTIHLAYEEMADRCSKPSFKYVNSILENWHSKGVTGVESARALLSQGNTKPQASNTTSYDIDKAEKKLRTTKLVYTKAGDN